MYRWVHNDGSPQIWETAANWQHGGTLSGVPPIDSTAIVCMATSDTVTIDPGSSFFVKVKELHLDATTTLVVKGPGTGLLVNGDSDSIWGPLTTVKVNQASLGGTGTILAQGLITFTSGESNATFLTSTQSSCGVAPSNPSGVLAVAAGGEARLEKYGLALYAGYHVDVRSGGLVTLGADTWFAADDGTSLTIQPGGTVDLRGDGGYYQGCVNDKPLSVFTNNGTLQKSAGSGTSVIEETYVAGDAGQVLVQSGTIALPGNQAVSADVAPQHSLATGRCDQVLATEPCQPTTDPDLDEMSVELTMPQNSGVSSLVQLQELPPVSTAVDPMRIGNEVEAHAEGLVPDRSAPARIELRFSQADVMQTAVQEVQVWHTPDSGPGGQIPDCAGDTVPAGTVACVRRPVTRTSDNTFVTVLAIETSRWRVRRGQIIVHETPSEPQGLAVKQAAPFDGSALAVTWAAPAVEWYEPGGGVPGPARRHPGPPGGDLGAAEGPGSGPSHDHRGGGQRRGSGSGVRGRDDRGGLVPPAQGARRPGEEGRQAHGRREVEGAHRRRGLRDHPLQGRAVHPGRTQGRQRCRHGRQAEVPVQAPAGSLLLQGEGAQRRPLGAVEQEDRPRPTPLKHRFVCGLT